MIPTAALETVDKLLGPRGYLSRPEDLALYEYDGSVDKARPDLVVFPRSAEEVAAIVRLSEEHNLPIVGRGAGTGLSGGAIPRSGGIVISFARMNRVLEIDLDNERAVLEPGVVNLEITQAVNRGRSRFQTVKSKVQRFPVRHRGQQITDRFGLTAALQHVPQRVVVA